MLSPPAPHFAAGWMELLCDLFLPVAQSQAVWGHDTLATRLFRDRYAAPTTVLNRKINANSNPRPNQFSLLLHKQYKI